MEDLIQKLMAFRQENNLTKRELAKKIGVKENDIICWEKKLSFPDDEEIVLIEKFFDKAGNETKKREDAADAITYGRTLKNSREELNLTKEELANIFNTTVDRLTMWEEDIIEPDEEEESLINSYLEAEFKKTHNQTKAKKSSKLTELKINSPDYESIGEKSNGAAAGCIWVAAILFLFGIALICCGILIFGTRLEMIIIGAFLFFFGFGLFFFGVHLARMPQYLIMVSNCGVVLTDQDVEIKFTDIDMFLSRRAHGRYGSYDHGEVVIITKSGERFIQGFIKDVEWVVSILNKKLNENCRIR